MQVLIDGSEPTHTDPKAVWESCSVPEWAMFFGLWVTPKWLMPRGDDVPRPINRMPRNFTTRKIAMQQALYGFNQPEAPTCMAASRSGATIDLTSTCSPEWNWTSPRNKALKVRYTTPSRSRPQRLRATLTDLVLQYRTASAYAGLTDLPRCVCHGNPPWLLRHSSAYCAAHSKRGDSCPLHPVLPLPLCRGFGRCPFLIRTLPDSRNSCNCTAFQDAHMHKPACLFDTLVEL